MRIKKIFIAILLLPLTFLSSKDKNILLLHSYSSNYSWTKNIEQGVMDRLESSNISIDIKIENLDIINNKDKQFKLLYDLYSLKYPNNMFDIIITADNNALDFVKMYRDKIWGPVPTIFCGVNGYNKEILDGITNISGIVESEDIEDTIDIILQHNPQLQSILFWSMNHKIAINNVKLAEEYINTKNPKIKVIQLKGDDLYENINRFSYLTQSDAILLFSSLRDDFGRIIPAKKVGTLISNMSFAPVYALHDIYLDTGIVGGKVVSGYHQGEEAANFLIKLLNGRDITTLPIMTNSPNRYIFDETALYKSNIEKSLNPKDSIYVNPRPSFYRQHTYEIRFFSIFILTLASIILFSILYRLRKQRIRETHLLSQRSAIFDLSSNLFCIATPDGRVIQLNKSWMDVLGWNNEELLNQSLLKYIHPDDKDLLSKEMKKIKKGYTLENFQSRYLCKNGGHKWLEWNSFTSPGDKDIVVSARDITQEKIHSEELERLATQDELTSIHNRRNILNIFSKELSRAQRFNLHLGIFMIDIDHFKDINDRYGHQKGDEILKKVTNYFLETLRDIDSIGRYGGDEFIVILPESNKDATIKVAQRMRKYVQDKFLKEDIQVTISIGCTILNPKNDNPGDLIEIADKALYNSKNSGRNRVSFK